MTEFKDYFSGVAASYRDYRPRYPDELFEYLAGTAPRQRRAWDVATGNGQAAAGLAGHFESVIATDASAEQIRNAEAADDVTYRVEAAESTELADQSVDMITVAQALHWFDLSRFEQEVRRVAGRGAILAVWSYGIFHATDAVDDVIETLYNGILGDYWTDERRIVERGYDDVNFDFTPLEVPSFAMRSTWSLEHLLGYLSTWSAAKRYAERHDQDPVALVADALGDACGDPDAAIEISWPLALKVWQVRD